jgi:hypothetical protein
MFMSTVKNIAQVNNKQHLTRTVSHTQLSMLLVFIFLTVSVLSLQGCKTSVRTLERWSNRPNSENLFIDWSNDPEQSTPEIRTRAVEMLIEQYDYEGYNTIPRLAELPQDWRDQAILDALPRITEVYEGASFTLGGSDEFTLDAVKVRDAVLALMETTDTPQVQDALTVLLVRWFNDFYDPCLERTGRHMMVDILSTLGKEHGLPLVLRFISSSESEGMWCQSQFLQNLSWLPEVRETIANAYIEVMNSLSSTDISNQISMVDVMTSLSDSATLKNWIFANHLTNAGSLLMTDPTTKQIFMNYASSLATEEDIPQFISMINTWDGNLRWMAFEHMITVSGAQGLTQALDALPQTANWNQWAGELKDDGLKRAATYICGRPINDMHEQALTVFQDHLTAENIATKVISMRCLAEIGNDTTITLLSNSASDRTLIPAWGTTENTVGALASYAIDRIQNPPPAPEEEGADGSEPDTNGP